MRRLSDYEGEWRTVGPEAFGRKHGSPALLRLDFQDDDDERAFQTAFMPAPSSANTGSHLDPAGAANLNLSEQEVYPVRKRAEGAFQDRVGIGRAPNVDISLPLPRVSKYHAFFTWDENGSYFVTDAGSKNGTMVEGKTLTPRQPYLLAEGAQLAFGPYRFVFFTAEGFRELIQRRTQG